MMFWVFPAQIHICSVLAKHLKIFPPSVKRNWLKMPNATKPKMSTLKEHLENERLQRIHRAWTYLTLWQKAWIFIRAMFWSLPSIVDLLEWHRERTNTRWLYRLYKVHWVK